MALVAWLSLPWLVLPCRSPRLGLSQEQQDSRPSAGWRGFAPPCCCSCDKPSRGELRQGRTSQGKPSQATKAKPSQTSSVVLRLDFENIFRFWQPFWGKRKRCAPEHAPEGWSRNCKWSHGGPLLTKKHIGSRCSLVWHGTARICAGMDHPWHGMARIVLVWNHGTPNLRHGSTLGTCWSGPCYRWALSLSSGPHVGFVRAWAIGPCIVVPDFFINPNYFSNPQNSLVARSASLVNAHRI